jgi:flagellar protein FlbD
MIQLTRLNGISIVLNSDLIKTAEASPDTMLTLINGEKIIVRETCEEVTERVLAYRARLLSTVARRLPFNDDLQRVVSIASLDVSGQSGKAGQSGQADALPPIGRSHEPGR